MTPADIEGWKLFAMSVPVMAAIVVAESNLVDFAKATFASRLDHNALLWLVLAVAVVAIIMSLSRRPAEITVMAFGFISLRAVWGILMIDYVLGIPLLVVNALPVILCWKAAERSFALRLRAYSSSDEIGKGRGLGE